MKKADLVRRKRAFFRQNPKARALLLFPGRFDHESTNFRYFFGSRVDSGALLLLRGAGSRFFVSEMNLRWAKEVSPYPVTCFKAEKKLYLQLRKKLARKKVGVDLGHLSAAGFKYLRRKVPAKYWDAAEAMEKLRSIKEKEELGEIRRAVKLTRLLFAKLEKQLTPGKSEEEICHWLLRETAELGAEPAFHPIVAAGKKSGRPHSEPGRRKLGKGIVLVDYGVKLEGYCSDMTRCFFLGKCKKERGAYRSLQEAREKIAKKLRPGMKVAEVVKFEKEIFKQHEFPAAIHSLGHGIGLEVHECPSLSSRHKRDKLQEGVVFTLEPGAYFPSFGVRYEDIFVLGKKGAVKI